MTVAGELLAALCLRHGGGAGVPRMLDASLANEVAGKLAQYQTLPRPQRVATLAHWTMAGALATPTGMHPDWVEWYLARAAAPALARAALAGQRTTPLEIWLGLAMLARLPRLPAVEPDRVVTQLSDVAVLPAARLTPWLAQLGAHVVVIGLGAAACQASLGRFGSLALVVERAIAQPLTLPPRLAAKAIATTMRAASDLADAANWQRLGAQLVHQSIANDALRQCIALRLPRTIGDVLQQPSPGGQPFAVPVAQLLLGL